MNEIFVTRPSMPPFEEYMEIVHPLFENKCITNMGEIHKSFENKLKDYLEVESLSLTVNGHLALENIINALNLSGEIITTPFTFVSTTHAIVRCGCTPVFCDIDESTFTLDVSKLETLITEKTCAIMPVHVYGNLCNMEEIEKIARKYKLYVIYDAAHAFGEKWNGKSVAQMGDASVFSFHATKVFNTIEGGCITFRDSGLQRVLADIKNFGFHDQESVLYVGGNAKMNEFQAAMGICNLRHIDHEIEKRKKVYGTYMELLSQVEGIRLWKPQEGVEHNYAYLPLVINDEYGKSRNELYIYLKEHKIYARKYFYPLTCDFECYRGKYSTENLEVARDISNRIITLPMYSDLSKEEIHYICKHI